MAYKPNQPKRIGRTSRPTLRQRLHQSAELQEPKATEWKLLGSERTASILWSSGLPNLQVPFTKNKPMQFSFFIQHWYYPFFSNKKKVVLSLAYTAGETGNRNHSNQVKGKCHVCLKLWSLNSVGLGQKRKPASVHLVQAIQQLEHPVSCLLKKRNWNGRCRQQSPCHFQGPALFASLKFGLCWCLCCFIVREK